MPCLIAVVVVVQRLGSAHLSLKVLNFLRLGSTTASTEGMRAMYSTPSRSFTSTLCETTFIHHVPHHPIHIDDAQTEA
ncbi:uncharacterized protein EDB93DRAFT_1162466 [Suillus bovinus]|uniref:uncharacterized protein n=1 Tax=Suillus bovinus TaxID=48563 RepID=UPI001B87CDB1|nr:uncharacterized protein EDB93DRAFT_1162466 [Suillus bovinus]KAG2139799.1 hypothetical protein EDB93DRAFT_1162466 [Suillus bovinus]